MAVIPTWEESVAIDTSIPTWEDSTPIITENVVRPQPDYRSTLPPKNDMQGRYDQNQAQLGEQNIKQSKINELQAIIDAGQVPRMADLAQYQDYLDLSPQVQNAMDIAESKKQQAPALYPDIQPVEHTMEVAPDATLTTPAPVITEPIAPAPTHEIPFAPSDWIGDVQRSAAALGLGFAQMGVDTLRGVMDLDKAIPTPRFIERMREKVGTAAVDEKVANKLKALSTEIGMYRQSISNEIRKEGGVAAEVAQSITDQAAETALTLGALGVTGFVGKGATMRGAITEAAKFGAFTYVTTPGTQAEKIQAAAHSTAFMLTPIPAAKMPTAFLAKAVNILENIGLTALGGGYSAALEQAKEKAKANGTDWKTELLTTATPMAINDILFGLLARSNKASLGQQTRDSIEEIIVTAPPEFVSPELKARLETKIAEIESKKPVARVVEPAPEVAPKPEEVPRAVQEPSPAEIPIRETPETGGPVVERIPEPGRVTGEGQPPAPERTPIPAESAEIAPKPPPERLVAGQNEAIAAEPAKISPAAVEQPQARETPATAPERPLEYELAKELSDTTETIRREFGGVESQRLRADLKGMQNSEAVPLAEKRLADLRAGATSSEVGKSGKGVSIEDAYRSGMDVKTISKTFGMDYTDVTDRLEKSGLIAVQRTAAPKGAEGGKTANLPTVLDALTRGRTVKPPKGATFLAVTDSQGRRQIINIKDMDSLKDAGPFKKVEWLVRGKKGYVPVEGKATVKESPKVKEPGLAAKGDIDVTAVPKIKTKKKGGFVSVLPGAERMADIGKTAVRWLKEKFTTSQGMDVEWNAINDAARNTRNMFDIHQKIVGNRVATAIKDFADPAKANQAVKDVLDGTKSIDQFKTDFRLSDTHPVVEELKWVLNDRAKFSESIAKNLETQGKKDLAKIVRDNKGSYLTRFYMKHIMGTSFEPNQADFQDAVDTVKADLESQLTKLGKRASKLGRIMEKTGGPGRAIDAKSFMETGDPNLISGLTGKQQDFARLIRDRYMGLTRLVEGIDVDPTAIHRGNLIEFRQKADAIESAANDSIDYLLGNKPEGRASASAPIDINHLSRRVLTPVFRKLYQEVEGSVEVAQKTAEVQGNMLVGLETVNKIYEQGAGKWWTRGAPDKESGLTVKLEGDRYGKLNGSFVSRPTKELLDNGAQMASEAMRMWENLVHFQRTIQVATSLPTTERNLLSGYLSFAWGSGDAMPGQGYHRNMGKAVSFVTRLATAKKGTTEYTQLLEELEHLAKIGVFHVRSSSVAADIMTSESNYGKSPNLLDRFFAPLGRLQNQVGKIYAYGDFITKYASYLTQKGIGKTDAQATEHVQKFYQHPSSLPKGLRFFSKLPLADYPTYLFDSIRIKKNQITNAATSAANGDIKPLVGFLLSNAAYALTTGATTWIGGLATDKMKEKIKALPDDQLQAMKEFQPDYWQNTPMFARKGTDAKGNPVIDYVVTSNLFAFPLDDAVMGAIQNKKMGSLLDQSAQLLGKTGMVPNSMAKLFTGQEIGMGASDYKTKGLIDIGKSEDPQKVPDMFGLIAKTALELALPVPRRVQQSFRKWQMLDEKLKAGKISKEDVEEQKADIIMSEVLPLKVRTITRDTAHDMMVNQMRPIITTIDDLEKTVRRGSAPDATETEKQLAARKEIALKQLYEQLHYLALRSLVAFKDVMTIDDIRKTVFDITGGGTTAYVALTGDASKALKQIEHPSSSKKAFQKSK